MQNTKALQGAYDFLDDHRNTRVWRSRMVAPRPKRHEGTDRDIPLQIAFLTITWARSSVATWCTNTSRSESTGSRHRWPS